MVVRAAVTGRAMRGVMRYATIRVRETCPSISGATSALFIASVRKGGGIEG
jgi:hypothetical protein